MTVEQSFTEDEIRLLDYIVQMLLRGGVPHQATRHKDFASLCRKVLAMKGKVEQKVVKKEG